MKSLNNFLVGILMGVVGQFPGASGSTVAVVFRIYDRLITDFANLKTKLISDFRFVLTVFIGVVLGYVVCAIVLNKAMEDYKVPLYFMFGALILIQIPEIRSYTRTGEKYTVPNWLAFFVSVGIILSIFAIQHLTEFTLDTNWIVMFFAGMIVVAAMIAPGISGSTILLVLGIYEAFTGAIRHFDMSLLVPIALGGIAGALLFTKVIDHFMTVSRRSTDCAIYGLTLGSVIVVFAEAFIGISGTDMILQSVMCAIIGAIGGYALLKAARTYSDENDEC